MTTLFIVLTMLLLGMLLGFIGAGGSGFMIGILTVLFGYPIHTAMGTALLAMMFTSLSGAISQARERNADLTCGILVGLSGAIGSWLGSDVAFAISPTLLKFLTASMLALSGIVLWVRMTFLANHTDQPKEGRGAGFVLRCIAVGLVTGTLMGMFGIGATPFIQVGLMLLLGLSMRRAAGTSMLVILPIAAAGGAGFFQEGSIDLYLLLTVMAGTVTGSYIGAKYTKYAPRKLLKGGMVATPFAAACLLLF